MQIHKFIFPTRSVLFFCILGKMKLQLFGCVLRANSQDPLRQVVFETGSFYTKIVYVRRVVHPRSDWTENANKKLTNTPNLRLAHRFSTWKTTIASMLWLRWPTEKDASPLRITPLQWISSSMPCEFVNVFVSSLRSVITCFHQHSSSFASFSVTLLCFWLCLGSHHVRLFYSFLPIPPTGIQLPRLSACVDFVFDIVNCLSFVLSSLPAQCSR